MTSGVYRRRQDSNVGMKPMFGADQIRMIRAQKSAGKSTKLLSSMWKASERTIRDVLNGTHAYKGTK